MSLIATHLVITVLLSLNRFYFFVLRCLFLKTSGFPLDWEVVLPQHSGCQDVTVPPQIRVWVILFCCYLLSADRCSSLCGDAGILYFRARTTPQFPLLSFRYLSITCRTRYFRVSFVFGSTSFRTVINRLVHFSPTLSLYHHAQWICRYSHPSELHAQHVLVLYILLT